MKKNSNKEEQWMKNPYFYKVFSVGWELKKINEKGLLKHLKLEK